MIENVTLRRLSMRRGIKLDDGPVRPEQIKLIERGGARSIVQVVLHEGRNRIVRRMFEASRAPGEPAHPHRDRARAPRPACGRRAARTTRDELGALMDLAGL